jgi:hypothetical protein
MRTVEITVTVKYVLEIDDSHLIVQDYEDDQELFLDCALHNFSSVLPVIDTDGVVINSFDVLKIEY